MTRARTDWWTRSPEEVARALDSEAAVGLSAEEAGQRLERDGPNELAEAPPTPTWRRLLRQFSDITVLALIVAALIATLTASADAQASSAIERFRDAIAIGLIVVVNAAIGFFQERKAERALQALRSMSAPVSQVIRSAKPMQLPSRELVVGDVVVLKEGDRVPADVRLSEASDLATDESALTGESVAVEKALETLPARTPLAERSNMAFLGTHVVRGRGVGLVVATAKETELGKIARMLAGVQRPQTPLQERLRRFGLGVVIGCVLVGIAVFALGILQRHAAPSVLLLTAVSLAVAVIPEGLPAITTIVLALGVERMAKKHALIRRLPAVESLGAATVICTDKTGTLTQNRMHVREVWCVGERVRIQSAAALRERASEPAIHTALSRLLAAAAYAPATEDPTDQALLRLFDETKASFELPEAASPVLVLPFDNQRRMASVVIDQGDAVECFTHGAPEAVLGRATKLLTQQGELALDDRARDNLHASVEALASGGLRVLALATPKLARPAPQQVPERGSLEQDLLLLGFVGLADPPRPEVEAALAVARQAGVETIMITGDHPTTARAIADELHILEQGRVMTGDEVRTLTKEELREAVRGVRVVARASAEHKLDLVDALRANGHVVAMTGDGVNDAPAIKAADIGVAMGPHSTDVTREAAGMVIYDGSYSTIVEAIAEGRTTYQNIKRFILFLFTVNLSLVIAVFTASIFGMPPILTPTQILWINLITNGLPALALGMEPGHEDPMQRQPRDPEEPIVRPVELVPMLAYGAVMAALGLGAFWVFRENSLQLARSAAFTVLAIAPLFHAFNSRSRWGSVFQLGLLSNWRLLGAFAVALCLQGVAIYMPGARLVFNTEPLDWKSATTLLVACSSVWVLGELHKLVQRRLSSRRRTSRGSKRREVSPGL